MDYCIIFSSKANVAYIAAEILVDVVRIIIWNWLNLAINSLIPCLFLLSRMTSDSSYKVISTKWYLNSEIRQQQRILDEIIFNQISFDQMISDQMNFDQMNFDDRSIGLVVVI